MDETFDDRIVPSTPTLFTPRRSDGFAEAVSSPRVPTSLTGRFTFNEPHVAGGSSGSGGRDQSSEHALEVPQIDDNSRSIGDGWSGTVEDAFSAVLDEPDGHGKFLIIRLCYRHGTERAHHSSSVITPRIDTER